MVLMSTAHNTQEDFFFFSNFIHIRLSIYITDCLLPTSVAVSAERNI